MIRSKCLNNIIYFDEIDKCDNKVQNALIHVLDQNTNHQYQDNFFQDINIDLSQVWFFMSSNNIENISPVLKNRIQIIDLPGFDFSTKLTILQSFSLPKLLLEYNLGVSV